MPRKDGPFYTLMFAAIVCTVCGAFVAGSAVLLHADQEKNKRADMQKNVLLAAGLISPSEEVTLESVTAIFKERVSAELILLKTGLPSPDGDADGFDQRAASADPKTSIVAPGNPANVQRLPLQGVVYRVTTSKGELVVIPAEGKGLWSTLYGFVALDAGDLRIIRGIAFYQHGETPGLGGEIENPKWQGLWKGREALDENFNPVISVIKGVAGDTADDPHHVDGLSGATITSNGVTHLVRFWLGEHGFGPYLLRLSKKGGR